MLTTTTTSQLEIPLNFFWKSNDIWQRSPHNPLTPYRACLRIVGSDTLDLIDRARAVLRLPLYYINNKQTQVYEASCLRSIAHKH